jgi:hypothetical protein
MFASWTWSLALIVLTTAMHSFGIVVLSLIGERVHAYLKGQHLHFWQAVMILSRRSACRSPFYMDLRPRYGR